MGQRGVHPLIEMADVERILADQAPGTRCVRILTSMPSAVSP